MTPSTPARRVLILGANGRLGAAAARAFADAGWEVLAQVRRAPATRALRITPLAIPLGQTAALAAAAAGASVVVHGVNPLYTRWDEEAMPLLRQGLAVCRALGAHFMLPGNVYAFGERMPAVLREDTPERPSHRKGEQRAAMEAEIDTATRDGRITASVIRAGDFFGAGTGSWIDLLIAKDLARGKLVYPGPLDVPHAWAYLPDLARAFVAVASQPQPPRFRRWHFAGHTLTGAQLLDGLAAAAASLGIAPAGGWRRGGFPWALIRLGGIAVPMWRELARMSYLWRVPHALDGEALAGLPGSVQTPIETALRDTLLALGHGRSAALQSAH